MAPILCLQGQPDEFCQIAVLAPAEHCNSGPGLPPEEKLHLRSLDSYPYNQKLTDFFVDKQDEMEKSGKHEYVLTDEDVENYSPNEIKTTFNSYLQNKNQNQMR